jgi:hypothetical protein
VAGDQCHTVVNPPSFSREEQMALRAMLPLALESMSPLLFEDTIHDSTNEVASLVETTEHLMSVLDINNRSC